MDYLLNLYEAISFEEYVEALHRKDTDVKQEAKRKLAMIGSHLKSSIN